MLKRKSIVIVYTRHSGSCKHRNESFARCDCSKWLRWSRDNKQTRIPANTRSWSQAEQKAEEQQCRLDAGESSVVTSATAQPTITDLATTFLMKKHSDGITLQTERKVRYHVKCFVEFMSARSKFYPPDVTPTDVIEFRASWSSWKSSVTRQRAQLNVRGFVRFIGRTDLLEQFSRIKDSKEDKARLAPKPFTEAELGKLLAQVPKTFDAVKAKRITAFIHCQVATGLAIRDTMQLERASLADGWLRINRQKTGKAVNQRLDPAMMAELLSVMNGNPKYVFWNGTSMPESATTTWQSDLRQLMTDAGVYIRGNLSHRFRDTAVDFWLGAGCSMTEIAALLGDSVAIVEKHYADMASKRMEDRLAKLPVRTWKAELR